jgi:hypothetical protein
MRCARKAKQISYGVIGHDHTREGDHPENFT